LRATLGAFFVAHVLITSVRRGRAELGVCRALGMRARDISSIVRWQATAVAVVGLAVGIPVGLAGGRTAWRLFADELGVPPVADIPWLWMALVALATLAALAPARRARNQSAAEVVRAE
jgi:ABC-type lipoprotein release transport system permease subunit